MFKHGKTGKTYYSIRDKIKYYKSIVSGAKTDVSDETKSKASRRLAELQFLDGMQFDTPTLVVTDDRPFGNGISKPRLCVAIGVDKKKRVLVAPVLKNTSNDVILDNDIERQISKTERGRNKWLDRSDLYEAKIISPHAELSERDIRKINRLYKK